MEENMTKNNKKTNEKYREKEIEEIWGENAFDPNGSYVGTNSFNGEPVQDADDL